VLCRRPQRLRRARVDDRVAEASVLHICSIKSGLLQVGAAQVRLAEVGLAQISAVQVHATEVRAAKVRSLKYATLKLTSAQKRVGKHGTREVSPLKIGVGQIDPPQVLAGK
jgi:hypothetical protein